MKYFKTDFRWIVILLNLLILLGLFTNSVLEKETLLKDGKLVLLELAPIDPRSLMQGDYMSLRYKIAQQIDSKNTKRGYCVVKLQPTGVADYVRVEKNKTKLNEGEYLIEYTEGGRDANIGAESYFFQEGQSERYDKAKYGGVRIDTNGNTLLIGLFDEGFKKL